MDSTERDATKQPTRFLVCTGSVVVMSDHASLAAAYAVRSEHNARLAEGAPRAYVRIGSKSADGQWRFL